jgi:type II secretory pathway pseudopilin PulG
LIELLVVVTVIAVLLGILLPTLRSARETARTSQCMSNLRQIVLISRGYADESKGFGPAVGFPYRELPNWSVVVQQATGRAGSTGAELLTTNSVLVCPTTRTMLGAEVTRTYGVNGTGHAGAAAVGGRPADPNNYDDRPGTVHVRFDLVAFPSQMVWVLDTSAPTPGPDQPPPTSTSSVLDFRNPSHVPARIGKVHDGKNKFCGGMIDGSVSMWGEVPAGWSEPLP